MLISVLGFGSIWTLRSATKARGQERFDTREQAYYNTTGVEVEGKTLSFVDSAPWASVRRAIAADRRPLNNIR